MFIICIAIICNFVLFDKSFYARIKSFCHSYVWMTIWKTFILKIHVETLANKFFFIFDNVCWLHKNWIVFKDGKSRHGLMKDFDATSEAPLLQKRYLWPSKVALAKLYINLKVWWLRKGKSSKKVISLNSLGIYIFLTLVMTLSTKWNWRIMLSFFQV